jgi:outer membrane protein OmpA-like peptidoglycan-associated protein
MLSRILILMAVSLSAAAWSQETSAPLMAIEKTQSRLTVRGIVSSPGHADILERTAAEQFSGLTAQFELDTGRNLPPAWSRTTNLVLQAMSNTQSATAEISPTTITMRGFTGDAKAWHEGLGALQRYLPTGTTLQTEVSPLSAGQSFESMCRQVFASALKVRRIEFQPGSDALTSSAYALLDELTELAFDCPTAVVSVTAGGDSSETGSGLGKSRANAIAGYLAERGVPSSRIRTTDAGNARARRAVFSITF